jgi:hypothetical protein
VGDEDGGEDVQKKAHEESAKGHELFSSRSLDAERDESGGSDDLA